VVGYEGMAHSEDEQNLVLFKPLRGVTESICRLPRLILYAPPNKHDDDAIVIIVMGGGQ